MAATEAGPVRQALAMAHELEGRGRREEARALYAMVAAHLEQARSGLRRRVGTGGALVLGLASLIIPGGGLAAAAVWAGLGYLAGSKGTDLVSSAVYQELHDDATEGELRLRRRQ